MTTHTPGPWKVTQKSDVAYRSTHEDQSYGMWIELANVYGENMEADARLIAAAPELLEALILLEHEMVESGNARSKDYGWLPAIEKTRAAIAKATGES